MKIATVIGARPQFIKAATVSRLIAEISGVSEVIIHTGQHYDANMSKIFFEQMQIPEPDIHLDVGGSSHGAMTGRMLEKIEDTLSECKPNLLLVYGDTNSTLAGALAASKMGIPIAHVEAGLRSFNMSMPEEVNRILTDRVSSQLFCPTDTAVKNLDNEGFRSFGCDIILSGDVMYDAAQFYKAHEQRVDLPFSADFVLATVHRAENTDSPERLKSIFDGLGKISLDMPVFLPLHPRTEKLIKEYDIDLSGSGIFVTEPVGYLEMVYLLSRCSLVMTDSGGLQKEAYFFGKPCVTMRYETEWRELIENGVNTLSGADRDRIVSCYQNMKSRACDFTGKLYGEGDAAEIIIETIRKL